MSPCPVRLWDSRTSRKQDESREVLHYQSISRWFQRIIDPSVDIKTQPTILLILTSGRLPSHLRSLVTPSLSFRGIILKVTAKERRLTTQSLITCLWIVQVKERKWETINPEMLEKRVRPVLFAQTFFSFLSTAWTFLDQSLTLSLWNASNSWSITSGSFSGLRD